MRFEDRLEDIFNDDDFDLYDRDSFMDLIDDLSGINRLYTNLLIMAFDSGLLEDISDEIELDQDFFDEHVETMESDYGLTHENAVWIVDTCCSVYGETVLMTDCDYSVPKTSKTGSSSPNKKSTPVSRTVKSSSECINLATLREGEKIPKTMVQRIPDAERDMYIDDFAITVTNDGGFGDEECIKVVGEITSDGLKNDVVIFIMVYNDADELIGASFDERIDTEDCNGFASFSDTVYLPKGELISRIVVRPVQNPAGFW